MKARDYGNLFIANDYQAVYANLRDDLAWLVDSRKARLSLRTLYSVFDELMQRGDATIKYVRSKVPDSADDIVSTADDAGLTFFEGIRQACIELKLYEEYQSYLREVVKTYEQNTAKRDLQVLLQEIRKLPDSPAKTVLTTETRLSLANT